MAGTDLINIAKDGESAICERRQLPAMEAAGWEYDSEIAAGGAEAQETAEEVPPVSGLQSMHKDGEIAWVDNKARAAMLDAGWEPGDPEEGEAEDLADILGALDPNDPELWNADGTLKMGAFNEAFDCKETRATVQAAWPDFSRDALLVVGDDE